MKYADRTTKTAATRNKPFIRRRIARTRATETASKGSKYLKQKRLDRRGGEMNIVYDANVAEERSVEFVICLPT